MTGRDLCPLNMGDYARLSTVEREAVHRWVDFHLHGQPGYDHRAVYAVEPAAQVGAYPMVRIRGYRLPLRAHMDHLVTVEWLLPVQAEPPRCLRWVAEAG
jgi:hypothetical protein